MINHFSLLIGSILVTIPLIYNSSKMPVTIVENRDQVIQHLCSIIQKTAEDSIALHGKFTIGLSGGSLVSFLVKGLPTITTDFTKWQLFFCDERLVPEDDPDSTFGVYKRQLLDTHAVPLNANQFVTVNQTLSPQEAAEDYEGLIKKYVPLNPLPQFDLLLLGMGPDGHTCSLFPGHPLLQETSKWVAHIVDSPKPPPKRVTLTFPVINNARVCVFAASGKEKAEMIKRIHVEREDLPATKVQNKGELVWIVDREAGSLL